MPRKSTAPSRAPIEQVIEAAAVEATATTSAKLKQDAHDKLATYFPEARWAWVKRRARLANKAANEDGFGVLCLGCLAGGALAQPDNAAAALCVAARALIIHVGGQPNERDDERLKAALETGELMPAVEPVVGEETAPSAESAEHAAA